MLLHTCVQPRAHATSIHAQQPRVCATLTCVHPAGDDIPCMWSAVCVCRCPACLCLVCRCTAICVFRCTACLCLVCRCTAICVCRRSACLCLVCRCTACVCGLCLHACVRVYASRRQRLTLYPAYATTDVRNLTRVHPDNNDPHFIQSMQPQTYAISHTRIQTTTTHTLSRRQQPPTLYPGASNHSHFIQAPATTHTLSRRQQLPTLYPGASSAGCATSW